MKNFIIKLLGKKCYIDRTQENGLIHRQCFKTLFGRKIMYLEIFNVITNELLQKYATSASGTFSHSADYKSDGSG